MFCPPLDAASHPDGFNRRISNCPEEAAWRVWSFTSAWLLVSVPPHPYNIAIHLLHVLRLLRLQW
jgi:hypothetical protein